MRCRSYRSYWKAFERFLFQMEHADNIYTHEAAPLINSGDNMGLYDTIEFTCPACGKQVEEQTKEGPCMLRRHNIDEPLPLSEIGPLLNSHVECWECGAISRIGLPAYLPTTIKLELHLVPTEEES
jgi:hypothetical protein